MSSVVERMRAAKCKSDSQDFQDGFKSGQSWASTQGEPAELERLEALWDGLASDRQHGWGWWFAHGDPESTASELWDEIFPTYQPAAELLVGVNVSGESLRGFAEGALEVWYEVKPQL